MIFGTIEVGFLALPARRTVKEGGGFFWEFGFQAAVGQIYLTLIVNQPFKSNYQTLRDS